MTATTRRRIATGPPRTGCEPARIVPASPGLVVTAPDGAPISHQASGVLGEPALRLGVAVDADVPSALEDDLEVVAVDGLVRPPAVDDTPLLAHERDVLAVDNVRRPARRCLHERRAWSIQTAC